jgi:hypothetical protein
MRRLTKSMAPTRISARARRSFHCPQESPCAETDTTSLFCVLVSSPDLDDVSDHGLSPQIHSAAMSQLFVPAQFERKGQMHASERTYSRNMERGGASRISWPIACIESQSERFVSTVLINTSVTSTDGRMLFLDFIPTPQVSDARKSHLQPLFFHIPHFGIQACAK